MPQFFCCAFGTNRMCVQESRGATDGFQIRDNTFVFKLKNENEGNAITLWRYQHFYSNSPFAQKRATLTACLRKVHAMASGPETLYESALAKVAEFRRLCYPQSVLTKACAYLGATTGERTWLDVRDKLREDSLYGPKAGWTRA